MVYIGYMGGNTAARNQRTQTMDIELYEELRSLLAECGGVTLGGAETLAELQELAEELFGDEI